MKVIIDTHVWLWAMTEPNRLRSNARDIIADNLNTIYISAVCSIEISIKWKLGRLKLPEHPEVFVPARIKREGFSELPINHQHSTRLATLPVHHKDPFDRLLIAQSQIEQIPIITADSMFNKYDVEVIRA